jgi:hypothetical protein
MSPASFLLRLLLAASLVVTTTGGALASMQMHLAQAGTLAAVAPAASADAPSHDAGQDCHEAADAGEHIAAAGLPAAPADHGDCCLGGDCDGICLLSLPPLPSVAFLAAVSPTGRAYRTDAHPDRAAPRLTRPQRPPIA